MKLRNPRLIRIVAWCLAQVIRIWLATVRYRRDAETARLHPADPHKARYIYAFWHETLLAPVVFRVPVHVLISLHADGELIARVCHHLGIGVARGSTTRGGVGGLLEMQRRSEQSHPVLMPDGPQGPRRKVQKGIIALAAQTGLPIVPIGIGYTWAWRARSWDRFAVPLPFSRITVMAGPAITIPPDLDREALERYRTEVDDQFRRVTAAAERWAEELAGRPCAVAGPHVPAHRPAQDEAVVRENP